MLPEEQELARLEGEQTTLENEVSAAELDLETTKSELSRFQYRYYRTVGYLYAELDDLEARLLGRLAAEMPGNETAKQNANDATQRAKCSAQEAGIRERIPAPIAEITPDLKKIYRQAAKLMHPDRATTDQERQRRHEMMVKVNLAYESGDRGALEHLIVEFGHDPEAVTGDDIGSRMIKAIRRIAQIRRRIGEIESELASKRKSEAFELMRSVSEVEAMGGNPLADLANELLKQISEKKIQLEILIMSNVSTD
jgi:hypothetical protein